MKTICSRGGKSHANIVCNPPYMRFQKFIGRDSVFRAFVDNLGLRLLGIYEYGIRILAEVAVRTEWRGPAGVYHAA